jgi:predicted metal-dependent peptidase
MTQTLKRPLQSTTETAAADAIGAAKTQLVYTRNAPCAFFATLALRLKYQADPTIGTAATDGRRIIYCPDFILSLSRDERVGLLAHEVMHITGKHFARMAGRDPELWNIACDLAINPLLLDAGLTLPACGCFPGQEPYEHLPAGLAAEQYYARLIQDQQANQPNQPNQPSPNGQPDPNASGSPQGPNAPTTSSDQGANNAPSPNPCSPAPGPSRSDFGGVMAPTDDNGQPLDDAAMAELDAQITVAVAAARQAAQRRGTLPGALERLIDAILAPVVDWRQQLREFMQPARQDYSWQRLNRRHMHRAIYLPALRSQELGPIVVAIDTSGSITKETLQRFASELDDIARLGAQSVTILYHDSKVVRVDTWTPDDGPLTLTPCGGGGTDHCPVFEWLEEHLAESPERPAALILLTDLDSCFPDSRPDVPTLWVSTDPDANHPFGDRIDIPSE